MPAGAVFITLVCAMFPALIFVALAVKLWEIRAASLWPEVKGKVVTSRVQSHRNRPGDPGYNFGDTEVSNEPFVEYEYRVGSQKYRCSRITIGEKTSGTELESILGRYKVGTPVRVYYDPANPGKAVLERTLPLGPMVAGGAVVLLFFIGVPAVAALGHFNALGWLKSHLARPGSAPIVAALTVFGIGVTLFAIAFAKAVRQASAWPTTRGRITESDVERFRDHRESRPIGSRPVHRYRSAVVYDYEVDGRKYIGDRPTYGVIVAASLPGFARRAADRYPVGREVDVHYNPLSPGESVLQPRSALHHFLWIIAVAVFALAWAIATGRI